MATRFECLVVLKVSKQVLPVPLHDRSHSAVGSSSLEESLTEAYRKIKTRLNSENMCLYRKDSFKEIEKL